MDHLVISDTQIKPSTDSSFCRLFGNYIIRHQPEKVIIMGDWWDMPSLSTYDKAGSLKAVGKNYQEDIMAGIFAMDEMMAPVTAFNLIMKSHKKKQYKPQMFFLMGNHEERIKRFVNDNPTLKGKVGYEDFQLYTYGFKWSDFLVPQKIDGIQYNHYIKNKNSNYPKASAKATLEQTFMSTIQGHKPGLDVHCVWSDRTGKNAWSIINGSSYMEPEDYRVGGGNDHWRGILHLRDVSDGDFTPSFISMDHLSKHYA